MLTAKKQKLIIPEYDALVLLQKLDALVPKFEEFLHELKSLRTVFGNEEMDWCPNETTTFFTGKESGYG